ncbi:MAG TPA: DUF6544 family protein, partial [Enhygromyxa sp.]|nr:DUF6544 family protein [Enhygromyxa sp.]
ALLAGLMVGAMLNRTAFDRRVDAEVAELFAEIETMPTYYSERELDGLPAPVQRFFRRNLQDGAPHQSCVRVREAGRVRQRPGQPWTEFVGEQYVVASTPAMLSFARLRPLPLVWVDARNLYLRGRGHTLVKLLSSLSSVDQRDDATRRALLVNYIAELALLPGGLLPADDRSWEPVDEHAARFSVRDGELQVAGVFWFDELGNVIRFESEDRPYLGEPNPAVARWVVRYAEHRGFGELQLPTKIDVEWQLDEQTFHHVERNVEALELDVPRRFTANG